MDAIYRIDGMVAETSAAAAGPWNADLQHGSAPASLVSWAVEQLPSLVPMQVARLTIDLLRPVPIGRLEIDAKILRDGKKIQLCAVSLSANGTEVVRATALKLRTIEQELPQEAQAPTLDLPLPEAGSEPPKGLRISSPFVADLDMRIVKGALGQLGPAAAWFRVQRPLIDAQPTSPLMRAAVAADFCNGVSTMVDMRQWTFINGDLTIHLLRQPIGEWILLDAETWAGDEGRAIAFGRLADIRGYFGRATQSVLLERR